MFPQNGKQVDKIHVSSNDEPLEKSDFGDPEPGNMILAKRFSQGMEPAMLVDWRAALCGKVVAVTACCHMGVS